MSIDVIIPWAGDCVYRSLARSWLESRWAGFGFNVIVGEIDGDGPWVKALAVREALRFSTADTLVISDGDVWSDVAPEVAHTVNTNGGWAVPFSTVRRLMAPASAAVIAGGPFEGKLVKPPFRAVPGGGLVILRRELYDRVPLDPRFVGWNFEDIAWGQALTTISGRPLMRNAPLWHLWHPPASKAMSPEKAIGSRLRARYAKARRNRPEMEALIAEARELLNC